MCLIVVKPSGIDLPKEDYLKRGYRKNPDGLGVAFFKEGNRFVKIKKDFKKDEELIDYIKGNVSKEDLLVVHFRSATHGLKDEGNRHPFPLTKNKELLRKLEVDCKSAMAHNGVLSQYCERDKTFSDSQKFVLEILSDPVVKHNLDRQSIQDLINDFLNGDRLAIINNKGELYLMGDFEEDEGIYYSNDGYKPPKTFPTANIYNNKNRQSNYPYGRNNHWDSIYGYQEKAIEDNRNKKKDYLVISHCEVCGKKKSLKNIEYKENRYMLCKKCRRKARKGTLQVIAKFLCASCRESFNTTDMELALNEFLVCKKCKKDIDTDV